jgi:hypothetical protein
MVSVHAELTFERLRYSFGGDRPSQTARLTMSPAWIHRRRLESQYHKGGIQRSAPYRPKPVLLSLPPILCIQYRNPILGCSKAPWGLSVLSRVTGIFTGTTISPGGLLRQCPDRYTIRAGQNLPDKEFRYLRTVIVTAAVYWGFGSVLSHIPLTFQHRAGVSPYTSSYDLAETCVFDKQSPGPILCGHISVAPLIPKLRGQFAEFLNNPSPVGLRIFFLPTCVGLRYGRLRYPSELFSPQLCHASLLKFRSLAPGSTNARVMTLPDVILLKSFGGYGMSTVCASTTPPGLALAPG